MRVNNGKITSVGTSDRGLAGVVPKRGRPSGRGAEVHPSAEVGHSPLLYLGIVVAPRPSSRRARRN